jgi:hypothetical protein
VWYDEKFCDQAASEESEEKTNSKTIVIEFVKDFLFIQGFS